MQPARCPGQPVDRAGHRHRRHHSPVRAPHRCGHRCDAGLALADAGGPAPPADRCQCGGGEPGPPGDRASSPRPAPRPAAPARPSPPSSAARRRPARCRAARSARSAAATQRRISPARRYSWALSCVRVAQPLEHRSGRAQRAGRPPAAAGQLGEPARAGTGRRSPARRSRCTSSATASRYAVGRDSPLRRPARPARPGRRARQSSTTTALSRTPTPLVCVTSAILPSQHSEMQVGSRQPRRSEEAQWAAHWPRRSGTRTWCAAAAGEPDLLYIDLHLVHEVTSPQAFDGLRAAGRASPPSRPHDRHRGPQRADHGRADRRPGQPHPGRGAANATARSSGSGSTRWVTPARASCTSSARSSG